MELLDIVEVLAKNPLIDLSILENSILSQNLIEAYKNSDSHEVRNLIAQKNEFSDMSHVIPFSDMSHVFPLVG